MNTLFAVCSRPYHLARRSAPACRANDNFRLGHRGHRAKSPCAPGAAAAGTTVYGGDRLSTEETGTVQIHAGAARLLLLSASMAEVNDTDVLPNAKLLRGTATFSTGNAHAFTLYASKAAIRAQSDAPTIGQVTFLNTKELLVTSKRGPLTISGRGETELIAEGTTYHVDRDLTRHHKIHRAQVPALHLREEAVGNGSPASSRTQPFPDFRRCRDRRRHLLRLSEALESPTVHNHKRQFRNKFNGHPATRQTAVFFWTTT